MKTHLAAILLAGATVFAPGAAFTSTNAIARTCGVDAPAGWEREGGFCDQRSTTGSLSTPVTGTPQPPAHVEEVIVDPCGGFTFLIKLGTGARVHTAVC